MLEGKNGTSIMADRGFTIKDMLGEIGVELNIPPFMEGRQQLPQEEIQEGRTTASLRIHVERAIGRMKKHFAFLEIHFQYQCLGWRTKWCVCAVGLLIFILLWYIQ